MNDKKLTISLIVYLIVVYSKRFWLGDLNGSQFWLADIFCFLIIPFALIFWITRDGSPFKEFYPTSHGNIKITYRRLGFYTFICFLVIIALSPIALRIGEIIRLAHPDLLVRKLSYISKLPQNSDLKIITALYFALTASIVEEFFFRGAVKKVIEVHISESKIVFLILSTIIFGTAHWAAGLGNVISTGLLGLGFALLYLWTKDLRPLMIGHFMYDFYIYAR